MPDADRHNTLWLWLGATAVAVSLAFLAVDGGFAASATKRYHFFTHWEFIVFAACLVLALVCFIAALRDLRVPLASHRAPAVEGPGSRTFHGGRIGGDSDLEIRSSADVLTHDTEIGDRARIRAEHHPGRSTWAAGKAPGADLDSGHGQAQESTEEPGSRPDGSD